MTRARVACALGVAAALAAGAAWAVIPSATKVERAVADANRAAGRSSPLLLDVRLQISGGGPSAKGTLATHPTGLARLELESGMGFTERHLLRGTEYRASRDGQPIGDPHPFLPPLFLLQAGSGEALGAALSSLGMADQDIVLGRIGDLDCYVLGGRRYPSDPNEPPGAEPLLPSLWVDTRSYDPVRMVGADGTEYRLSEMGAFKGIRFPRVIDIDPPGPLRARLEVVGATQADAPAAAFQTEWLTGPAGGADLNP
jgi:hypothetical protein